MSFEFDKAPQRVGDGRMNIKRTDILLFFIFFLVMLFISCDEDRAESPPLPSAALAN